MVLSASCKLPQYVVDFPFKIRGNFDYVKTSAKDALSVFINPRGFTDAGILRNAIVFKIEKSWVTVSRNRAVTSFATFPVNLLFFFKYFSKSFYKTIKIYH